MQSPSSFLNDNQVMFRDIADIENISMEYILHEYEYVFYRVRSVFENN